MVKPRLRTKFLLSMLLISAGLTGTSLLVVRHSLQTQVRSEIFAGLQNSMAAFQSFQRERELTLSHSADLLADLPNLRSLMTTQHEPTIQDASSDLWHLAGSDLFVLAAPTGVIQALHTTAPGFTRSMAQQGLNASLYQEGPRHWWFGDGHLYEIFLKPIYFGPAAENRRLGFLVLGYEIDDGVAAQLSRVAGSQVAFYYGGSIVRSTLQPAQEAELAGHLPRAGARGVSGPVDIQLGSERFLASSVELAAGKAPSVQLTVLKSYDQATAFLDSLNHLLLALGLAAVGAGSGLVFLISHTFTRPLGNLVAGVRALEKGDFTYALDAHGGDEVAEVTGAFNRMRANLLRTQQELLEAERLATIGRMASSISHDLRHSLAAIVANAEFLCEPHLTSAQREELYQEVRIAVNQMTDLIDSLLEFSRTRESLRPAYGKVQQSVDRTVQLMHSHPDFGRVHIAVYGNGDCAGWFDARKLERALYNLLLNACEAVPPDGGRVEVELASKPGAVQIRIADNGRGIPEAIRGTLFEPFVSSGKENGTGLGLTVVQKIVQDHGGEVSVEKTAPGATVFLVQLPLAPSIESGGKASAQAIGSPSLAPVKRAEG